MKITHLNGNHFRDMLNNALNNIKIHEQEVNSINVFPVPDGDTGSNMRMTLENGLKYATDTTHAGRYLLSVAEGMLYGARGNSGVILSQIFNGLANELKSDSIVDCGELCEGFTAAYIQAYKAVTTPKEGTLLTVAKLGIEGLDKFVGRGDNADDFFNIYLKQIKETLDQTPEMMPLLKEAGVVDSGGAGYYYLIEGFTKYLNDEVLDEIESSIELTKNNETKLNIVEVLEYGYCTEFLLKLVEGKNAFDQEIFTKQLVQLGNSVVVAQTGDIVKVHVHSKTPGEIMNIAQLYGEFVSFKLENMDEQHEELTQKLPYKELGIIIVAEGEGIKYIYKEFNPDIVINATSTMSVSTEEFVQAISKLNCEKFVVITNNKNNVMSCEQAFNILKTNNGTIINSPNIINGYYCLAVDDPTSSNLERRIQDMLNSLKEMDTIEFFKATKDTMFNNVMVKKDYYTSSLNEMIVSSELDFISCIKTSLEKTNITKNKESIILLKGKNFNLDEDELTNMLNDLYPDLDVVFLDGGQSVRDLIIGLL